MGRFWPKKEAQTQRSGPSKRRLTLPLIIGLGLAISAGAAADTPPQVILATAGSTQSGSAAINRFTLRFSADMVALGDPRATAPASQDCKVPAKGRWVDTRTWVLEFDNPVPAGKSCNVELNPRLKTLSGLLITGQNSFLIDTGGPTARAIMTGDGYEGVEEDQIFLVATNVAADRASVARFGYCAVDGIGEKIPLNVLPADRARDIINGLGPNSYAVQYFASNAGFPIQANASGATNSQSLEQIIPVQCRRPLPPGRDMALVWDGRITQQGAPSRTVGRDQRFDYRVRSAFTAKMACSRVNAQAGCNPIKDIVLRFSSPIPRDAALETRLSAATNTNITPQLSDDEKNASHVTRVTFRGPLPQNTEAQIILPADLKDQSGRPLANRSNFPMRVKIDAAPSLVKFAADFGILEASEGGVLPITVRAVEPTLVEKRLTMPTQTLRIDGDEASILDWMRKVEKAGRTDIRSETNRKGQDVLVNHTGAISLFQNERTPSKELKLTPPSGGKEFEVIGIPLTDKGFHVVEVASPALGAALLGRKATRYVAAAALVTDMAVHFKWGREQSLAWVTSLKDGTPISGAAVRVVDSCSGKLLSQGKTDKWGRLIIPSGLPQPSTYSRCDEDDPADSTEDHGLMVSARHNGDFSFTLTDWGDGIRPYDFDLPYGWSDRPQILHTIFDRSLVKAGETVHMKHVRRLPAGSGFSIPAPMSGTLKLRHRGSSTEFELPFAIGQNGSGESVWSVPKSAPMGDYDLIFVTQKMVKGKAEEETIWSQQSVRVDEYRLPTMKAVITGPKQHLIRPTQVPLNLFLGYLSGGPAANAPVDIRTQFTANATAPKDYRDWEFDGEQIKEGLIRLDDNGEAPQSEMPMARSASLTLGADGTAQTQVAVDQSITSPTLMSVEMDYPDANGQTLTSTRRITLYPSSVRLGVKTDGWMMRADDLRLRFVALDLDSKPLSGQRVDVALYSREILTARRRLIGGFYAYDNQLQTTRLNASCAARTDKLGRAACTLAPNVSGEVIVVATTRDADGQEARAVKSIWLAGKDDWWFGGDNGDRMDVIPEKTNYKAGDTAKFQVRMPFREATALVTVEREGVLSSSVVTLKGDNPVVQVKLPSHYAPDVYVSVLAVRGRVTGHESWFRKMKRAVGFQIENSEGAAPTARVDLGKPAYRLGISRIRVGWEGHQLSVDVKADKPTYSVKETAQIQLEVKRPDGKAAANAQVAFSAVDEALLTLSPNPSWDILSAMMGERALDVLTSTAQMQVVGKRHYGRKALEPGGGGGGDLSGLTRDSFQPVLLWQANVTLDAQGRATINVPLSDNLSAFRMVAIANDGAQFFGSGDVSVRTVQDLAIISATPELVRTDDQFDARFTLRNSTAKAMRVTAQAAVLPAYASMPPLTVDIPAGGAVPVSWKINAPTDAGDVQWQITARSADARQMDRLEFKQHVEPSVPLEVWAQSLRHINSSQSVPVTAPAGAIKQSYVDVALADSVAPPLANVRAYMQRYPYDSLEHKVSRAIVLDDPAQWQSIVDTLPTYIDDEGLLRYWPRDRSRGSAELTAYILAISSAHGFALPESQKSRLISALQAVAEGRLTQRGYGHYDVRAVRIAALAALARNGSASANMVSAIRMSPSEMTTSTLSDWLVVLDKTAAIQNVAELRRTAEAELRRRIVYEGMRLDLVDDANSPWWMMISSDEMAIKALEAVMGRPAWKDDDGRMMMGVAQRQRYGRWDSTPANAWGAVAVRRFAKLYPAQAITGVTMVSLDSNSMKQSWPLPTNAARISLQLTQGPLRIEHQGTGAPWATVTVRAAVPLTSPMQAGYSISRKMIPVTQKVPNQWTRGDVIKIQLTFKANAGRTWVAVRDPLPPGASVIGNLGGQSLQLVQNDESSGAQPDYVEAGLDNWQAHYGWLPAGEHRVEYVMRLNGSGTFSLPETRIEALYAPSIRGAWPNGSFQVVSP